MIYEDMKKNIAMDEKVRKNEPQVRISVFLFFKTVVGMIAAPFF